VQLAIQILGNIPVGTILSTTARIADASGARARAALDTAVENAPPLALVLTTDTTRCGSATSSDTRCASVTAAPARCSARS